MKTRPAARIRLVLTLRATFEPAPSAEVVAPCGRCREVLEEYAPDAYVVIPSDGHQPEFQLIPVGRLLPHPFRRRTVASRVSAPS